MSDESRERAERVKGRRCIEGAKRVHGGCRKGAGRERGGRIEYKKGAGLVQGTCREGGRRRIQGKAREGSG